MTDCTLKLRAKGNPSLKDFDRHFVTAVGTIINTVSVVNVCGHGQ